MVAGLMAMLAFSAFYAGAQAPSDSLVPNSIPLYAPKAPPTPRGAKTEGAAAPSISAQPSAVHQPGTDYLLGPGDKLRITVFEEEDLTGEFFVAGNGAISFPLIGDVNAAGKTVKMVQDAITAKLRDGYIKDPRVNAEVVTFRPYYILGEVAKPGEYPYSNGMTVLNAIATAGGFTYRANSRYVFIKRAGNSVEQRERVTGVLDLKPGDTVRVGARLF